MSTSRDERSAAILGMPVAETVDEIALRQWRDVSDVYCAWFNAEQQSGVALRAWYAASPAARPAGYAAYRAALDREEAAAKELHRLWHRACR